MNTKVLIAAGVLAGVATLGQVGPAKAFTYIDPATDLSTATGYDASDPYITLKGVTYGQGSGGNSNFQEFNTVTYDGQYSGITLGLWQDSQPGTTTFDFWANNGNNPVLSLRIGGNDYLGVVSRQVKTGNTTLAFQWSQINTTDWRTNGTVTALNPNSTYLLWISTPEVTTQSTSSDPPLDDLNKELAIQASTPTPTNQGVPAPLPFLALPVMFGFLPKLRRARILQKSVTSI